MTYIYIGSRTQQFGSDKTKSFLNEQNLQNILGLYLIWKNRIVRYPKLDSLVFAGLL
jgi:hypothetical protein